MQRTLDAYRFIRRQAPQLAHWTDEVLFVWVASAVQQKRMVCVYDADQHVVGLGAARCLSDRMSAEDWYSHDEDGDTIYADLVLIKKREVIKVLWEAMKQRFGSDHDKIAFRRLRDERFRSYDFKRFDQHITRNGPKDTPSPASP